MFKKILIMLPAVFVLFVCGCDLQFEAEKKSDNENTTLLDLTKIKQEREKTEREKLEAELAEAERLEEMAHKLDMIVTAGSDFHGSKVRADRHIGETAGAKRIEDRFWEQELRPALLRIHGDDNLNFEG